MHSNVGNERRQHDVRQKILLTVKDDVTSLGGSLPGTFHTGFATER